MTGGGDCEVIVGVGCLESSAAAIGSGKLVDDEIAIAYLPVVIESVSCQ